MIRGLIVDEVVYTKSLEEKGIIVEASRRPLRFKLAESVALDLGLRG